MDAAIRRLFSLKFRVRFCLFSVVAPALASAASHFPHFAAVDFAESLTVREDPSQYLAAVAVPP